MIIISHRGAAGMEPENTIPGIEAAVRQGVALIEFDIQPTSDDQLIVFHDDNLLRICGKNTKVSDLTLAEINVTSTKSGYPIPTFHEALEACGDIPALIDCKGKGWSKLLIEELKSFKGPTPMVTSQNRNELVVINELRPDIETYISELTRPFDAIHVAKSFGLTGISLNFWVLNPLSYWYAIATKRKIMVFTVNKPALARFVHFFYPRVSIITNMPHILSRLNKSQDNS